ncbi:hypothetical protein FQB35_09570 [Crassaminicella thermophila]|uniref:Uncharacterized protein n=1 Tax=Crassaminicella thermophila TaxID=2599308 RepID=A0A5C0SDE1_CRATE|nr:hypothetical protein [Crassaminicella thermophila]QEK12553.1 hypothetical protein FQB35_09570 [Crassaminicella thermophila]
MFYVGVILLIFGSIFVYGTKYLMKIFKWNPINIKFIGLFIAVIGIFMIINGEFPKSLEFIRYFKGKGVLLWK